jgi:hypothetical protein
MRLRLMAYVERGEANAALERLTEDFGAELATARREGGLAADAPLGEDEALAVVYGFARGAVERDPENFARIVAMVQGTMIANASASRTSAS